MREEGDDGRGSWAAPSSPFVVVGAGVASSSWLLSSSSFVLVARCWSSIRRRACPLLFACVVVRGHYRPRSLLFVVHHGTWFVAP